VHAAMEGAAGVLKPRRVSASVGAECARMPSVDRYQATATAPDFVLRHHETKSIDTQRNSPT